MPEGPEAATLADQLYALMQDQWLLSVKNLSTKLDEKEVRALNALFLLLPLKVIHIFSKAKQIWFQLRDREGNDLYLCATLGMSGFFTLNPERKGHLVTLVYGAVSETENLLMRLIEGEVYYGGALHRGHLYLYSSLEAAQAEWAKLGPDMLKSPATLEEWRKIFRNKRLHSTKEVWKLLMEPNKIGGIGNYLMSEICYDARVHPAKKLVDLTDAEIERLYNSTLKIINLAYKYNGLTLGSYQDLYGRRGVYEQQVYKKETDPKGNKVEKLKRSADDRYSYFVAKYQPL